MLLASEVLERAHNENRICGGYYSLKKHMKKRSGLCAVGFLIEPFANEYNKSEWDAICFASDKYEIPYPIVDGVEDRYEGFFKSSGKPQSLLEIASWLREKGY